MNSKMDYCKKADLVTQISSEKNTVQNRQEEKSNIREY